MVVLDGCYFSRLGFFGWVMQRSLLNARHNTIYWGEIEQTLSNLYTSKTGASTYPPIMMFKILILQAWYALSDEVLEKQIDLCSITRESANEFCWVFFQDILGVLWLF
jgi:hypothetical protein